MKSTSLDTAYMTLALAQARAAACNGEVPVGAVVVRHGEVIAVGRNAPVQAHDPTAHAEIVALRAAAKVLGNYRLQDCEMFVTLEPCAMCSGAILHARLQRVVFGAIDPKTGAAGSVMNLFLQSQLNHQTEVVGGVLAQESAQLLRSFFKERRVNPHPLREDALRPAASRFLGLPDYPWAPHFISDLPSLNGLRMHYLDEGPTDAPITWLCLHGNPSWSYIYRKMIPVFLRSGGRVVAPDLIGFGKSDQPKKDGAHHFSWHRSILLEFIEQMNLQRLVLVMQDWGGLLGLTLPMVAPERYQGMLVMNTTLATGDKPLPPGFMAWRNMCTKNPNFDVADLFARENPHLSAQECAAYNAPFPDKGHRAALRAFPAMVPDHQNDNGAEVSRQALAFFHFAWQGKTLMAIGQQDPVFGESVMRDLASHLPGCTEPMLLPEVGHFVQEHGECIAEKSAAFFAR